MCTSSDFRLSIRHLDYLLLQLWILLPIPEECVGVASCLPCVGVASCLPPRVGVALCFRCVVLGALDSSRAGGAPWNYCQNAVFCRSLLTALILGCGLDSSGEVLASGIKEVLVCSVLTSSHPCLTSSLCYVESCSLTLCFCPANE